MGDITTMQETGITVKQARRSEFWDAVKGVAIIAVILIHSSDSARLYGDDSIEAMAGVLVRQFVNFAVPLFIALSGYFAVTQTGDSRVLVYYKKRFLRILLPYVLWSMLAISLKDYTRFFMPMDVAVDLLLGRAVSVYYFIPVLLQLVVITPFLIRLRSRNLILFTLLLFVPTICVSYYCRVVSPCVWGDFPYSALPCSIWIPFYSLGIIARRHESLFENVLRHKSKLVLVALYVTFFACFYESFYYLVEENRNIATSQIKLSNFLFSGVLCGLIFGIKGRFEVKQGWLSEVGGMSYGIYLSHMFVLPVMRLLVNFVGVREGNLAYILLTAFFTLFAVFYLMKAAKRLLGSRSTLALGF